MLTIEEQLRALVLDIRRKPVPIFNIIPTLDAGATEIERLRARVAELEVIAISICAGNCLPPFPCAQDGCPKRASASAGVVPE